eukprot:SAG31_NODE_33612_length_342_cov_0.510288_1_plen_47_part_10
MTKLNERRGCLYGFPWCVLFFTRATARERRGKLARLYPAVTRQTWCG